MKKFLMGAAAVLLALGGLLTGCTNGDDDDDGTSDVGKPKILQSIDVDYSQAQTVFTAGTTFSAERLKVTANFTQGSESSSIDVDVADCIFKIKSNDSELKSGVTELTNTGLFTVIVSYTKSGVTKSKEYDIEVIDAVLTSISVDTSLAPTEFAIGNVFSTNGLVVTATYAGGKTGIVALANCTFKIGGTELTSGETKLTNEVLGTPNSNGKYTVTVSYNEKNGSYEITVAKDVIYVGLGGENLLKVSKVEVDGVAQVVTHAELQPSDWNKIDEFETVALVAEQSVSFTFRQPTQGEGPHNSWALAIWEVESYAEGRGQFVRGDTWLNKSTDAGFTGGIWSDGNKGANFTYEASQDYLTTASKLPTDKDVVITVSFDGTDIEITQTIGGAKSMTASSTNWTTSDTPPLKPNEPSESEFIYVGLGVDGNTLNVSKVEVDGSENSSKAKSNFKPTSWNAISEFITVELGKGSTVSFTFQQPSNGTDNWNTWSLAIWEAESYAEGRGQFVRGDTWLNSSTGENSAGFTGGIWSAGACAGNFTYETGYNAVSTGKTLPTDKDVVITVSFDGTDIEITQTIDGVKSMTASSKHWVPQKVTEPSGSTDYYALDYPDDFTTTIDGQSAIDVAKYQSNVTHDANPPIWWESPLYGMEADELKEGITIQADVYSPTATSGHDALLTFYKPGDSWNALAIGECGSLRFNSGTLGAWYDLLDTFVDGNKTTDNLVSGKWCTVTVIFNADNSIKYYLDSDEKAVTPNALDNTAGYSYNAAVNYFTTVASQIGIGVGLADGLGAQASYVDEGSGIKNIRIYPEAITIGSKE